MAVFKLLIIQTPATAQTVTYAHNMGVVPKAAIAITSRVTTLDSRTTHAVQTIGFYDGTSKASYSWYSKYQAGQSEVVTWFGNYLLYSVQPLPQAGSGTATICDIMEWTENTVTMYLSSTESVYVGVLLIGGGGVQAKLVEFASPGATGLQTIGGVGFRPDLVLFLMRYFTELSFGVAGSDGGQFGTSIYGVTGATTTSARSYQDTKAIALARDNVLFLAGVTEFTNDGFTLSWNNVYVSGNSVYALCISGLKTRVASFLYNASGQQSVTGVGFRPELILLSTIWNATIGSTVAHASRSIGIADGTSIHSTNAYDQNARALSSTVYTNAYRLGSNQRILHDTSGTTRYATLTSIGNDGFTVNWSAAPPVSNTVVWYVALKTEYSLRAETNFYGLAGSSAATISDRFVSADSTTYTQVAAKPQDEWAARADHGTQTVAGAATLLDVATGVQFPANSGLHEITGVNTTTDVNRIAHPGIYAASGTAITIDRATALETGSYTLTGAESLGERTFGLGKGTYVLSGQQAGLLSDAIFRHDPGLYGITGREALFIAERLIVPEKGNLIIVGNDASLTRHLFIETAQGNYNATGALVGVDLVVNATTIPYTITGAVSTSERTLIAATEAYALAGVANEMRGPWAVSRGAYGAQGRPFGTSRFSPPRALLARRVFIPVRLRRRGIQGS